MARALRAVSGESVERSVSVSEAAASGDRLKLLVALRTVIAEKIDDPGTPARDLAALTNRQLGIAREIESIVAAIPSSGAGGGGEVVSDSFDASAL